MTARPTIEPRRSSGGAVATRFRGLVIDGRALRVVLTAYLATRLTLFAVIFISQATIPNAPFAATSRFASASNPVLDGLIRWDSWGYAQIATTGYDQYLVVDFPVYPLLVKVLAGVFGDVYRAGVVISNLALLVALGYLYALVRRELDEGAAGRAVWYLAAAPGGVFLSAMYTESLFLTLVTATFYYARERRWIAAAATGALASATRNTGVLLALVIALESLSLHGAHLLPETWTAAALRRYGRLFLRAVVAGWRGLLAALCVPIGLLAYMAYLNARVGDPLAFLHASVYGSRANPSLQASLLLIDTTLKELYSDSPYFWSEQINGVRLLDVLVALGCLPLLIIVARRLRPAYTVYAILTYAIPLSTGTMSGLARYSLMLVPCFVALAYWGRREWADRVVLSVFLPLMTLIAVLFTHYFGLV